MLRRNKRCNRKSYKMWVNFHKRTQELCDQNKFGLYLSSRSVYLLGLILKASRESEESQEGEESEEGHAHFARPKVDSSRVITYASNDIYKPIRICHCDINIECTQGILINMPPIQLRFWVEQKLEYTLINCSINGEHFISNRAILTNFLRVLKSLSFYDINKTINLSSFFQTYSSSSAKLEFFPCVAVVLNSITGERLFVQFDGIALDCTKYSTRLEINVVYIRHEGIQMPLKEYLLLILKDKIGTKIKPGDFIFEVLKIGPSWISEMKRKELIKKLTKNAGILSYNSTLYRKNKAADLKKAQSRCICKSNYKVSLSSCVHLGSSLDLKKVHSFRTYANILEASRISGICHNKIISRVFSQAKEYKLWYLAKHNNVDPINSQPLESLDRNKTKVNEPD